MAYQLQCLIKVFDKVKEQSTLLLALVDTNDIKDSNHAKVTGTILSLELDFLREKMQRKCRTIR